MKKPLRRIERKCWHFAGGKRVYGAHDRIWGDLSGIEGDVSGIGGNFNEIPMECRNESPNVEDWIRSEEDK